MQGRFGPHVDPQAIAAARGLLYRRATKEHVMIDITTQLDTVRGGVAPRTSTPPTPPTSKGIINPAGTNEARAIQCLPAPTGGNSPYQAGDWICRETGAVGQLPQAPQR
jgi:hypothetical protein